MESEKLEQVWRAVCDQVKSYNNIDPSQINAFFSRLQPQAMSEDFLMLTADNDFIKWYADVQRQYGIEPYVKVENPDPFFTQNRYQGDNGEELFFLANSHLHNPYRGRIVFTDVFFPGKPFDIIELFTEGGNVTLKKGDVTALETIRCTPVEP